MAHLLMPVEEGFDVTTIWSGDAMRYSQPPFAHLDDSYGDAVSKYNPTPGGALFQSAKLGCGDDAA